MHAVLALAGWPVGGSATIVRQGSYQQANVERFLHQGARFSMSSIPISGPCNGPAGALGGKARPARNLGFSVPSSSTLPPGRTAAPGGVAALDLAAMLSLQDVDPPEERAGAQDRRARRQGDGLLAALARLQHAWLGGPGGEVALADLSKLADQSENAASPALREVVAEIRLRAAVELARAEMMIRQGTSS